MRGIVSNAFMRQGNGSYRVRILYLWRSNTFSILTIDIVYRYSVYIGSTIKPYSIRGVTLNPCGSILEVIKLISFLNGIVVSQ